MHIKTLVTFLFYFIVIVNSKIFAQNKSYNIEQYDLYIQPDFVTKHLFISTIIKINNPALQDTFYFGINNYYETLKVKSNLPHINAQRENGWIVIALQKPEKNLSFIIETEGIMKTSDSENRDIINDSSLFLIWSDKFYPIDYNHWAKVKTTIILPDSFHAIAPGKLISTKRIGKKLEYIFETTNPAVCFSVFADSRWIITKRKINGIQMQTLLYPECQKFSEQIFNTSSEILKFYSETYCPYSFDQFSFVNLDGIYARRAFPGFVGYNPSYLEKEFTTTGFDAHETALLWGSIQYEEKVRVVSSGQKVLETMQSFSMMKSIKNLSPKFFSISEINIYHYQHMKMYYIMNLQEILLKKLFMASIPG